MQVNVNRIECNAGIAGKNAGVINAGKELKTFSENGSKSGLKKCFFERLFFKIHQQFIRLMFIEKWSQKMMVPNLLGISFA